MAKVVRLDRLGMRTMLQSGPVQAAVADLANSVSGVVEGHESITRHSMPVEVEHYITDRAASAVVIKHAGGLGVQAKYGALTQAASSVGLQVRSTGK